MPQTQNFPFLLPKQFKYHRLTSAKLHTILCLLLVVLVFSVPQDSSAASTPSEPLQFSLPLTNVYAREKIELSGSWKYIIDPHQVGLSKPGNRIRNFPRDLVAKGNELVEYEFDSAPEIQVPGDWNTQIPELAWYEGLVWYRKSFEVTPKDNKRYFLYFEGANYWTRAHLNGKRLGEHNGGFTPFAYEVTGLLEAGRNSLVVAVDNTRSEDSIPALDFDWKNYGGITRPVYLVETSSTYIDDYQVWLTEPDHNSEHWIEARVKLGGSNVIKQDVAFDIPELNIRQNKKTDDKGWAEFRIKPKELKLWSPNQPYLYAINFKSESDEIHDDIGFRTISVKGEKILLNNTPVFLKGISLHEESIGKNGNRTLDWSSAEKLLGEAKALGCNYVRLAHYPHSEKMTRLADRMGLLVWSEIPMWQKINFQSTATFELAQKMLVENIHRDKNRASIIIWSVANETPINELRLKFITQLIAQVRELDPTRLVSAAMDKSKIDGNTIIVEDPLGEFLDILAINQYEGWYGKRRLGQISQIKWQSPYQKPLVFSEFGAGALSGYRSDRETRWSEDYQRYLYEETLKMADNIPFLQGISPWILKDFRSPRRYHPRYQNGWNRKGLINEAGKRKLAFKTLHDWYQKKP